VSIGVTRDADNDSHGAFQSVSGFLTASNLPAPASGGHLSDAEAGTPRAGIYILPDCVNAGMLEDLCLEAVSDDLATSCVNEFLDCVVRAGRTPGNLSKARVHAWLSSQVVPDRRLGEAARAGMWPWDSPTFDALKEFLLKL
jgi:hypothetical protein